MIYCVKPVVCDYGIFERTFDKEDKLIAICNSLDNANLVAKILNADHCHEAWRPKENERVKMPEHSCVTCIYGNLYADSEPCCNCTDDNDMFEPIESEAENE